MIVLVMMVPVLTPPTLQSIFTIAQHENTSACKHSETHSVLTRRGVAMLRSTRTFSHLTTWCWACLTCCSPVTQVGRRWAGTSILISPSLSNKCIHVSLKSFHILLLFTRSFGRNSMGFWSLDWCNQKKKGQTDLGRQEMLQEMGDIGGEVW